jgi:hypothetical protein
MLMVTIGMLALFGLAALGLDTGMVFWDKARLQNAVDAAALSGAKTFDQTGSTVAARDAALGTFNLNAAAPGNASLGEAVDGGFIPTVQFSATLNPFVPGAANGPYVRVIGNDLQRGGFFSRIFGIDIFNIDATAVAGPSPTLAEVCDIAPVMVCGDAGAGGPTYGYTLGEVYELKLAAGYDDEDIAPGNFHLIRVDDSDAGGSDVRDNFAGLFDRCLSLNDAVETEPGNTIGPTQQGTDTRFEPCRNPLRCDQDGDGVDDILPDMVTTEGISYQQYRDAYANENYNNPPPDGEAERRILRVPITDCSVMGNGQTSVPVLGIGCFFMTEQIPKGGNQAYLKGEFFDPDCAGQGIPGPAPGAGAGPYIIQLYKDPDGVDS